MPVQKMVPVSSKRKRTSPFSEFSKYEAGRVRNLRFNTNALADFEQETGMGFAMLMKQRAVFGSARAMLWAGLKHEDRSLTMEDVGNLMDEYLSDEGEGVTGHSIDALLTVAITAAVQQGAFGRVDKAKAADGDDEEEKTAVGPNAGEVIEGQSHETSDSTTTIQEN